MKLLLDTHVLVWLVEGVETLQPKQRAMLEDAAAKSALSISAISFWEVAMLERQRRLALSRPVDAWRRDVLAVPSIEEIPLGGDVAVEAVHLPGDLHADPADRFLVATARLHGAALVTRDRRLLDYSELGHVASVAV